MRFAIITSSKDKAGRNIRESILKMQDWIESHAEGASHAHMAALGGHEAILCEIEEDTVHSENLDKHIHADCLVFATRHESASKKPGLLLHTPGNFSKAGLGGADRSLCIAAPLLLKTAFRLLNEIGKDAGVEITMEATHHGPMLGTPALFIEIGSSEAQWEDRKLGEIIGKTIMETIRTFRADASWIPAIGIGGTHYCANFNQVQLDSDIAVGHICPKYMLQSLDSEMLDQMIKRSEPGARIAVVDWKGMSEHKESVLGLLKKKGIEIKKTKDI